MNVIDKLSQNNSWIKDGLLFLTLYGSRAYGTNTEQSDFDYRGMVIPPREYYFGFKKKFEQQELKDPDTTVYEINKFFSLAAANNPSIIETLFTREEDHVFVSPLGKKILENRDLFLSKRCRSTFQGYATSQMRKMQLHREWLRNPIDQKPERKDFNLPDKPVINENQLLAAKSEIRKDLEKYNLGFLELREDQTLAVQNALYDILGELNITKEDQFAASARKIGFTDNFIEYMQQERRYDNAVSNYNSYQNWKKNRNPKRAADEAKHGADLKFAYHLIRLTRMAKEILETGKVNVYRPDREELLYIRNGGWSYEQIIEYVENQEKQMDEICAKSKLPGTPDMEKLDSLCELTIEEFLYSDLGPPA